jgi:voltage-gated potassium channel
MTARSGRELKGTSYEVFILLLSILSVANLVIELIGRIVKPEGGPGLDVIVLMDAIITPFFIFDFTYRFVTASSKRGYFLRGAGWADLLACIPMLRIFRWFRIVRAIHGLRAYGPRRFFADLDSTRASAAFLLTVFLVIVVVEVAGALIYYAEGTAPDANIRSAGDAVWWGLVTITTVGYGDRYPVTPEGRVIGVFLLFAGIGLFSVLTGFIANAFLGPRDRPRVALADGDPRAAIVAVRLLLSEQEERTAAIRQQLDELERGLRPGPRAAPALEPVGLGSAGGSGAADRG